MRPTASEICRINAIDQICKDKVSEKRGRTETIKSDICSQDVFNNESKKKVSLLTWFKVRDVVKEVIKEYDENWLFDLNSCYLNLLCDVEGLAS